MAATKHQITNVAAPSHGQAPPGTHRQFYSHYNKTLKPPAPEAAAISRWLNNQFRHGAHLIRPGSLPRLENAVAIFSIADSLMHSLGFEFGEMALSFRHFEPSFS